MNSINDDKEENTDKIIVFLCYCRSDRGAAEAIKGKLERNPRVEILTSSMGMNVEDKTIGYEVAGDGDRTLEDLWAKIRLSSAFVLLYSKETFDDRAVTLFCESATMRAMADSPGQYKLIRLVLDDIGTSVESPYFLHFFTDIDYRDPIRALKFDVLVETLLNEQSSRQLDGEIRRSGHFETFAPDPGLELLRRFFRAEFDTAFSEHVGPIGQSIQTLANLRRAQETLMTPELVEVKEAQADDDIWVVTHTLQNDIFNFHDSVRENLIKGIRYIYFLPDTELIRRRVRRYKERFNIDEIKKSQDTRISANLTEDRAEPYRFIFIERGVFMPFDEMVIYDADNAMGRWGYIQMSYDRASSNEIFMRIPERTLSTIVDFLRGKRDAEQD